MQKTVASLEHIGETGLMHKSWKLYQRISQSQKLTQCGLKHEPRRSLITMEISFKPQGLSSPHKSRDSRDLVGKRPSVNMFFILVDE